MSADKPVSLAERIAACCPCRLADRHLLNQAYCDNAPWCACGDSPDRELADCHWPGHALEAEARELDAALRHKDLTIGKEYERAESAEARVAALTAVLSAVVASGLMRAIERLADAQVVDQEEMDVLRAIWKRAAALAERKP